MDLAHKFKETRGETSSRSRVRKRSYEEMEEELNRKHQECQKFQASESSYKKKIQDLEKQLKAKDVQIEKETKQKHDMVVQYEESKVHTDQLLKENVQLKSYCQHLEACLIPEI